MQSLFLLYKEGCEILKKVLCFLLAVSLTFSNCLVAYADLTVDGGGNFVTTTPTPPIPTDYDPVPKGLRFLDELLLRAYKPGITGAADLIQDTWNKYFGNDEEKAKEAIKINGDFMYFNGDFINQLNVVLQDKVHALDGYFMIVPPQSKDSFDASILIKNACDLAVSKGDLSSSYVSRVNNSGNINKLQNYASNSDAFYTYVDSYCDPNIIRFSSPTGVLYLDGEKIKTFYLYDNGISTSVNDLSLSGCYIKCHGSDYVGLFKDNIAIYTVTLSHLRKMSYGAPIRVFYSQDDARNYYEKLYANKPTRRYVPKLPSGGFKVNIKYINNTTNLPDITYNITTENKTETEIQNQYDTTINNYLNDLNDFTDGSDTVTPTPTPSGGGSGGDFGDGTTPTPKPDFSDGSLTDTNTLLQKILDKLTEFSTNHDKLAKTITDYIQKNDGKLEEILLAIQALSDGKTETEQNGCKYDFTALSEYLTKLWNDSDKKFDEMIKLLEENNKYQQKLVDSLNEIKALLIADTVMDFFKDRSQETAEKAKDKFPTSIPWDISLVLNSMSAEPKNPKFSLPIKIESFKINETIDIDLSTDEWEKLAKTCRYILSVTFILFLIHLSRKLFSSGGDD